MRRFLLLILPAAALAFAACGDDNNGDDTSDGGPGDDGGLCLTCAQEGGPKPGCVGLGCKQVDCGDPNVKTTLTGTVYDPAGKVPVFNAIVYVTQDPDPKLPDITDGASCDRCDAKIQNAVVVTSTDTAGNFTLKDVPVADNLPVVIQIGKWRRLIRIPTVQSCKSTTVDKTITRLPRNSTEGHIPRMAVTTGAADPLQCLLHKVGLDDSEFGVAGSNARIHLYQGGGFKAGATPTLASSKMDDNTAFPPADGLWSDTAKLKSYDVVLLGCEGDENDGTTNANCPECITTSKKTPEAKTAIYDYAKAGGRIFASHYHYVWFSTNPDAAVKGVAQWKAEPNLPPGTFNASLGKTEVDAEISTAFPKVVAMKDWLAKQSALTPDGKLHIVDGRYTVSNASATGLDWMHAQDTNGGLNVSAIQQLTFNTPIGAADAQVCGRVVFSDLHVGSGAQGAPPVQDDPQASFPTGSCKTTDLSPQQRALEFMLFDLSSCVQNDQGAIEPPH